MSHMFSIAALSGNLVAGHDLDGLVNGSLVNGSPASAPAQPPTKRQILNRRIKG